LVEIVSGPVWAASTSHLEDLPEPHSRALEGVGSGHVRLPFCSVPDWVPIIERGGLDVVTREEIPNWAPQLKGMYDAWVENIDVLRAELGDEFADDLLNEAHDVSPKLARRWGVLYTAEKHSGAGTQ
jgi:hypothetical protein